MFVWSIDRMYWETYTDKETGEVKTIGILCYCALCGLVKNPSMPLVRFDATEERTPDGYPHTGICGDCIARAQRAIDHRSAEAGMVRIGSPYCCTHCRDRVTPVVWFNTESVQEQYICARCLTEAQRRFLIEQEDLQDQKDGKKYPR